MTDSKRRRIKEAAVHAIRSGKVDDALKAARHLVEEDPLDAEAHQILGLVLSRQGEGAEAIQSLQRAIDLAPEDPKHHYNLAVLMAESGEKETALRLVRKAHEIEPSHRGAKHLLDVLEGRVQPEAREVHVLTWIEGRERAWDRTGLVLAVLSAAIALVMVVRLPASPTGRAVPKGQLPDVALRTDAISQLTVMLLLAIGLACFFWMLTDIVDRRKRLTWLAPMLICGVMGLNAIPFILYYFVGRKIEEERGNPA